MRILFHTHEFNIKEGGPCTKRIDSFASYFSNKGYEVVILTGKHNKKNEYASLNKKYKIIYSPILACGKKKNIYRFIEQMSFAITSFFKGIFSIGKCDFVITTSPPPLISFSGYFLAKIKKAKLVYDVRDIWPDVAIEMNSFKTDSIYYKVFSFIANFMYKHSYYITTVSPGKVKKIIQHCNKLNCNSKKVKYIPNGLDDNFLHSKLNENIIKKYNLDRKCTICYIGNVGLAQDLDSLLDMAKVVDNDKYQFLIFGEGAQKNNLEKRITTEKIDNAMCCGKIDYSDVYTILSNSKISFISLKNSNMKDSIPTKIFDAIGAGCPILLLANGDSCKIIDETKFGEHIDNPNKLVKTFNYMINNYDKYLNEKDNSLKIIKEKYLRSSISEKFEKEVIKND